MNDEELCQVLEKVELAARRAFHNRVLAGDAMKGSLLNEFADELARIIRDHNG